MLLLLLLIVAPGGPADCRPTRSGGAEIHGWPPVFSPTPSDRRTLTLRLSVANTRTRM